MGLIYFYSYSKFIVQFVSKTAFNELDLLSLGDVLSLKRQFFSGWFF